MRYYYYYYYYLGYTAAVAGLKTTSAVYLEAMQSTPGPVSNTTHCAKDVCDMFIVYWPLVDRHIWRPDTTVRRISQGRKQQIEIMPKPEC